MIYKRHINIVIESINYYNQKLIKSNLWKQKIQFSKKRSVGPGMMGTHVCWKGWFISLWNGYCFVILKIFDPC